MVMVLWKMNNEPLNITSSDRHSVQEETANDVYNSMLTVNPTSSSADSGNYSCIVTVYNNTISSEVVASDNVLLNITSKSMFIQCSHMDYYYNKTNRDNNAELHV